eukprot:TRINITY_DN14411_c0_g1_i1.p1 TRINITY_DN14411_c0_g1~~TRINITY_DN14411_c0_g1_i1.p1  ORF type:complete len:201 (+),score=36.24 TRINITY_DN14411_c0_g1_i1:61-663(+)
MASVQDGEAVDTLAAMFSNLDRDVIMKVLRSCGGNTDRAIEKLLVVSDNPAALDSLQTSEASQMAQDEALARELQRELIRAQAAARPRSVQPQPRARVAHAYNENEHEDSDDFGLTEAISDLGNSVTKTFEGLFSSIGKKLNPNKQKDAGQYKAVAAEEADDSHVVEFDSSLTHREKHDQTEVSLEDKRATRRNESKKEK